MKDEPRIEKDISQYFAEAIGDNYLIVALVSSYTKAKYHSRNLPFGLGKTTLAFDISYSLNGGDLERNPEDLNIWNKVFSTSVYNSYALGELLKPGSQRIVCSIWDDVQLTAPATQSVPIAIRELANFISVDRPEVAIIIMTAPNINKIAAPLRQLVNFEIIVSERGFYEVHKLSYYKNFRKPLQDKMHFDYICENPIDQPFPPFTPLIQERYNKWRTTEKLKLYPNLMRKLKTYNELRQWEEGEAKDGLPTLECEIIKTSAGYAIKVPQELGEQLHRKPLKISMAAR